MSRVEKTMKAQCQSREVQIILGLQIPRKSCRKTREHMNWVYEHIQLTQVFSIDRVPLPEKGERVGRRGRKATGQSWALIAGLPKEQSK